MGATSNNDPKQAAEPDVPAWFILGFLFTGGCCFCVTAIWEWPGLPAPSGAFLSGGIGFMAGLLVRECRKGMTKDGSGPGALAGLAAASLSWAASMSLVLSRRIVAEQQWVRTLPLPAFLVRMELSEISDTLFRYSLYDAGLNFSLAFVLVAASLAGALGAIGTSAPEAGSSNFVMVLQPPSRGQTIKVSVLVSSLITLLASTPVLLFGGEDLNRTWWLIASLIVGLITFAVLAMAVFAAVSFTRRLGRTNVDVIVT
jgi:hypothetical protein